MPDVKKVEYGGVIVKGPGHTYKYTTPITMHLKDKIILPADYVETSNQTLFVDGMPVVGRYHSHPCMEEYDVDDFSAADVYLDKGFHSDGYMLSECTGNVYWHDWQEDTGIAPVWHGHNIGYIKEADSR